MLDKRHRREADEIRFVPARWTIVVPAVAGLVLRGGKASKLGLVGLAWSFAPRPLKVVAFGLIATWVLVALGSLAAIALLVLQLS